MATSKEPKVFETGVTAPESTTDAFLIASAEQTDPPPTLTTIPTEIRLRILQKVVAFKYPLQFVTRRSAREPKFQHMRRRVNTATLLCNKQLHYETLPEFFKQNTITFDPTDVWNILPPYAFQLIKHLKIKLNSDTFCGPTKARKDCIQLQYFQHVKTLTLTSDDVAASVIVEPHDLSSYYGTSLSSYHGMSILSYYGMYNISVSEVIFQGFWAGELMDRIKMLFNTSKVGRFRRVLDSGVLF